MMITLPSMLRLSLVLGLLASPPAHAALEWTRTTAGTHDWLESTNWLGGVTPSAMESEAVILKGAATTSPAYTIRLNTPGDQILSGGLAINGFYNTVAETGLHFDLNTRNLILDGGTLSVSRSGNIYTKSVRYQWSNGTLQLGTDTKAASLDLGVGTTTTTTASQDDAVVFNAGTVLDTYRAGSITVAASTQNFQHHYTLDLTAATLRSGNDEHTLKVEQQLAVGAVLNTSTNGYAVKKGAILLGRLDRLEVGQDLIVGQNNENRAVNLDLTSNAQGRLSFLASQGGPVTVEILRDLRIGVGLGTSGVVEGFPAEVALKVGNSAARGNLFVGYQNFSGHSRPNTAGASGRWEQASTGSFEAYLQELRIGVSLHAASSAEGAFHLSNATLSVLDIAGDAVIGKGVNATGELRLSGGNAVSHNLSVGEASGDPDRSLLRLDGTRWVVNQDVTIGDLGEVELVLGTQSAGLVITNSLSITGDGILRLFFEGAPGEEAIWGLQLTGDWTSSLGSYLGTGAMVGAGAFGADATLYFDGSHTYYGLAAIPEPSTCALLGLGAVSGLILSRRRRFNA